MYPGRRFSTTKRSFPFGLFGIFVIVLFFIISNRFLFGGKNILIPYLFSVNISTFFIFGMDKLLASLDKERIPEKILYVFCVVGGTFAGFIAMYLFRHKTQKASFQSMLGGILFLQILVAIIVYNIF